MGKVIDLTGQRFGRLTVIERVENTLSGKARWKCQCECGSTTTVITSNLLNGNTKSCGCYRQDVTSLKFSKHKQCNDRIYSIWCNMKSRCLNVSDPHYKWYGAKHITVCSEWIDDFEVFYEWSINNGYHDGLSIDRINNDLGYSPDNCRWVTQKVQCNNKSNNCILNYEGRSQTISQWSNELNIPYSTLNSRINRGWSIEKALTTPVMKKG